VDTLLGRRYSYMHKYFVLLATISSGLLFDIPYILLRIPAPDNYYIADVIRAHYIITYNHDIPILSYSVCNGDAYYCEDFWFKHIYNILHAKPSASMMLSTISLITGLHPYLIALMPIMRIITSLLLYMILIRIAEGFTGKDGWKLSMVILMLTTILLNSSIGYSMYYRSLGLALLYAYVYILSMPELKHESYKYLIAMILFLTMILTYYSAAYYALFVIILSTFHALRARRIEPSFALRVVGAFGAMLFILDNIYPMIITNASFQYIIQAIAVYISKFHMLFGEETTTEGGVVVYGKYLRLAWMFDLIYKIIATIFMIYFVYLYMTHSRFRKITSNFYEFNIIISFVIISIVDSIGYSAYRHPSITAFYLYTAPFIILITARYMTQFNSKFKYFMKAALVVMLISIVMSKWFYFSEPLSPYSYNNRFTLIHDCLAFPVNFVDNGRLIISTHTCTSQLSYSIIETNSSYLATELLPNEDLKLILDMVVTKNSMLYLPQIYETINIDVTGWDMNKPFHDSAILASKGYNIVYRGLNGQAIIGR